MEEVEAVSPVPTISSKDIDENRLIAALGWLWVLSVVILLVKKDSPFAQFHARQGFTLFIVSIFLWLVFGIFGTLAWVLQWLLELLVFVIIVVGFVQALRGRWWVLPILGPLAPKVRI